MSAQPPAQSTTGTELAQAAHVGFERALRPLVGQAYRQGYSIACGKGCHACCYEIVSTLRQEAELLVERVREMPPEDQARIEGLVRRWLDGFREGGLDRVKDVAAVPYRKLRLACPLLKDGLCGVYEDRPMACRGHLAVGRREQCEDDALRPEQQFLKTHVLLPRAFAEVAQSQDIETDHLGIWLAELLLGEKCPTPFRASLKFKRD